MKKGVGVLLVVLLVALEGVGLLPEGYEPEERQIVTALALDDNTCATAVTGVRASEREEAELLTGTGESLSEACRALRGTSVRRAYLGQVEQVLLGEGQNVLAALDFLWNDGELRLNTLLYIVEGDAGELLASHTALVAAESGGKDPAGREAGEILSVLARGGVAPIPLLRAREDTVERVGWVLVGPGGREGAWKGVAAEGAELLLGLSAGKIAVLENGSVELTEVRTIQTGETLSCVLVGRRTEGIVQVEELETWGWERLEAALACGKDGWGLDCGAVSQLRVEVTGRLVEKDGG